MYTPSVATFGQTFRDDGIQSRMGRTTTAGESVRPMTAISGAGFQSQSKSSITNQPFHELILIAELLFVYIDATQEGNSSYPTSRVGSRSDSRKDNNIPEKSPQEVMKHLSKEINQIIEESSTLLRDGQKFHALQKAQIAVQKDKKLSKYIDDHSLSKQQGRNLTYSAWFHLTKMYEENGKYDKAIEAYETLVKQKKYRPNFGQIRISIGNLYSLQGKYNEAIRMYKMALDQTARNEKELKTKILLNLGNCFVKQGKLRDAVKNFEDAIELASENKSFFNLVSCYVQLGDDDKSKQTLFRMISATKKVNNFEVLKGENDFDIDITETSGTTNTDLTLLHDAARLVARMFNEESWVDNFLWVYDQLNQKFPEIAIQIEIERSIEHLKRGEFQAAVKIFKSYEHDDLEVKAMVATNLSFIYFHEGNYTIANEYADIALASNKYNPTALVNKGNCLFIQEHYERAREFYLEAVAIKSTCFEAIYNLSLVNLRLGHTKGAMQSLVKLHTIFSNDAHVLYQVANIYEETEDVQKAKKWFNVLCAALPNDPGILSRVGQLFLQTDDQSQCFHYHLESFRCYPSNIDVTGWLAIWFVKHEMFEKSIHFFHRASQIQPKEIKWKIMIATCYRKMGRHQKAFTSYKKILNDDPENVECK